MQKNDLITIEITDITAEGSGIGRYDGMVIFVPLTAVGDTARVKILKVKKTYAYAKLEELITPSADRTENTCEVFRKCGGCTLRHISYEAECRFKYNKVYEDMKRIGGTDIKPQAIIPSVRSERYRNKAQYPLAQGGAAGFFALRSHRIVPCGDCALQPEIFSKITDAFMRWTAENGISIYSESEKSGLLRHIYIRYAEKTDEIMVCAVINGDNLPCFDALLSKLKAVCGKSLKSVQININRRDTNVILGERCRVLYGEEYITDILSGLKIRLSPLSFYQVNRATAEKLYEKAAEYADPDGKNILDLYCGAGTIGLSMADRAESVIGVEIVEAAVEDARFNAAANGIENASFICADAAKAAEQLERRGIRPDTVIADPPRKGLDAELISIIANKFRPERVVYISCDPATLARDVKLFGEQGYELREYTPVDMFPRTVHVECACLLIRKE